MDGEKFCEFKIQSSFSFWYLINLLYSFVRSFTVLRTLGLSFTDTPTMSDAAVVSFAGAHNETVSVAEVLNYAMQKALTDTATMSDSPVLNPNLGKTDSVSFSDVFTRVVTFERSFADAISSRGNLRSVL